MTRLIVAPCERNILANEDFGRLVRCRNNFLSVSCWMKFQKVSFTDLQSESKDKEVETKASSKIKTQQEQSKLFRRKADL